MRSSTFRGLKVSSKLGAIQLVENLYDEFELGSRLIGV